VKANCTTAVAAHAVEKLAYDLPLLSGPQGERLITPTLLPLLGINYNRNHLRRMWTKGEFPRPLKLSARKLAWPENEITAWLASRGRG